MTEPDDREPASTSLAGRSADELSATARLCPYLLADGGWRSATPAREHRCTVLRPPTRLSADKQRRLCLTADHTACPTFLAAAEERAARAVPGGAFVGRPIAMTAPVVIERSRSLLSFESPPGSRRWGQLGLVMLMLAALVVVIVARSGGDGRPAAGGVQSVASSPSAMPDANATASPAPTPGQSDAPAGGPAQPTASSNASPGPAATSTPTPPPTPTPGTTYTVKRGDTLSSIAVRFGTTVAAIQELNGIENPSLIRVGEVLQIP